MASLGVGKLGSTDSRFSDHRNFLIYRYLLSIHCVPGIGGWEGRGEQTKSPGASIRKLGMEKTNAKQTNGIILVLVSVIKKTKLGYMKENN